MREVTLTSYFCNKINVTGKSTLQEKMHICTACLEDLGSLVGLLPLGLWHEATYHFGTPAVKITHVVATGM